MELKELKFEDLLVRRFNLENEYNTIKAYLLVKINRMEEIEKEIQQIDNELKLRTKSNK